MARRREVEGEDEGEAGLGSTSRVVAWTTVVLGATVLAVKVGVATRSGSASAAACAVDGLLDVLAQSLVVALEKPGPPNKARLGSLGM